MKQVVCSHEGKIVLVQYLGAADPDTGGVFSVKRYRSEKTASRDGTWRHDQITLLPLNPDYRPIVLNPEHVGDVQVVAEWLSVLR